MTRSADPSIRTTTSPEQPAARHSPAADALSATLALAQRDILATGPLPDISTSTITATTTAPVTRRGLPGLILPSTTSTAGRLTRRREALLERLRTVGMLTTLATVLITLTIRIMTDIMRGIMGFTVPTKPRAKSTAPKAEK